MTSRLDWLRPIPDLWLQSGAYLAILGIGWLDYVTGSEIAISILYALPIFAIAWRGGRMAGMIAALIATLVEMAADLRTGHAYSHWAVPAWNGIVRLGFLSLMVGMLTELYRALEQEARKARFDFLTGLENRRSFYAAAAAELQRSQRYAHPFAVLYLDLDNFKAVNDRLGHQEGDRVLKATAATLLAGVRTTDHVARLGGDEFVVLLTEVDPRQINEVADRLREQLQARMRTQGWPVTVSSGLAVFLRPPPSVDAMITRADQLMYQAKRRGKNTVCHKHFRR